MIADEQIRLLANKYQTTELNIRREYFQHLFLSHFYSLSQSDGVYFKGGTALRIFYQSPRFSEDLDFTSVNKSEPKIEELLLQVLSEIEKEGIESSLKEAKTTSGGYLAHTFFTAREQTVNISLQISFRQTKAIGRAITVVNDFVPAYTIMGLAQEELIFEKIQALLERQKPRDFYDLYFILRASLLCVSQKRILPKVLQLLAKTGINFEQELKQFLPKSHWAIIKDFKTTLEREIKNNL